jgi:serine/threonine protein kinase
MIGEEDSALVELWESINSDPPPKLDPQFFSPDLVSFVEACMRPDPYDRPNLRALLDHPFVISNHKNVSSFNTWVGTLSTKEVIPAAQIE